VKLTVLEGFYSSLLGVLFLIAASRSADTVVPAQPEPEPVAPTNNYTDREKKVLNIIRGHVSRQDAIYEDLEREFRDDLRVWNATLSKDTLSVRFSLDDMRKRVMFEVGSYALSDYYTDVIRDFCPRYAQVLSRHIADGAISAIHIEGHTSSEGPGDDPFVYNMVLSQQRSLSVLTVCLGSVGSDEAFRRVIQASGRSSSNPVLRGAVEDLEKSRRVEVRVQMASDKSLNSISDIIRGSGE
jgi:outer membrane protein OmpA-like peptidoglycan-associated protein